MQAAQNFICDPVATRRFGFDNEHVGLHLARGAVGLELKAGVDGSGLQKAYACLAKPAFSGRTCSAEHHPTRRRPTVLQARIEGTAPSR